MTTNLLDTLHVADDRSPLLAALEESLVTHPPTAEQRARAEKAYEAGFKTCRCGRKYDLPGWMGLKLRGRAGAHMSGGILRACELRDCVCGSTIALMVVKAGDEWVLESEAETRERQRIEDAQHDAAQESSAHLGNDPA